MSRKSNAHRKHKTRPPSDARLQSDVSFRFGPAFSCGLLLTALAALRCFGLGANSVERTLLPLLLLGVGALALFLLKWEGTDPETLSKMLLPVGAALLIRAAFLSHATLDYQDFLSQWVNYFREHGGFRALADHLSSCNYNVPYLYMLCLLTYLPLNDLYGIKLFSILFDVLLAWGALRLVRQLTGELGRKALIAFSVVLILPTVVLNGSCWGQCDSVWGALCLLALSFALEPRPETLLPETLPKERPWTAPWISLTLLGLAFSFKLQAIFIVPLWLVLWLGGKVQFRHLFAFPAAFFASALPALLLGKPIWDILGVYVGQASDSVRWNTVNYNSPSVFSLVPWKLELPPITPKLFIVLDFLFLALLLLPLIWRRKDLSGTAFVLAGVAMSLGVPFFLPYMHERYFFLGGVLLAVLACARPTCAPAAMCAELASLGGYHAYLRKKYALVLSFFGVKWTQLGEGLLMIIALTGTIWALFCELRPRETT